MPAFVYAAMQMRGITVPAPLELPALLGVRVGPDDRNPLSLPVVRPGEASGVTRDEAQLRIPETLRTFGSTDEFRHVPLKTITFGLYEETLAEALSRGVVVGLGLEFSMVAEEPGDRALHLLRVVGLSGGEVELVDDSTESGSRPYAWDRVREAVLAARDGLWLIGQPQALALRNALPWTSGTDAIFRA